MSRPVVAVLFAAALALLPAHAFAQEPIVVERDAAAVAAAFSRTTAALDIRQVGLESPGPSVGVRPSRLLHSLLVSTVVVQALDVHSTFRALDRGAVEANPVMAPLAGNKGAFIATKAAVAAVTVLAAQRVGKRNKVAAIATLVAVNTAYAFVIDHNYRVARGLR